jgi:hypothetical protein
MKLKDQNSNLNQIKHNSKNKLHLTETLTVGSWNIWTSTKKYLRL